MISQEELWKLHYDFNYICQTYLDDQTGWVTLDIREYLVPGTYGDPIRKGHEVGTLDDAREMYYKRSQTENPVRGCRISRYLPSGAKDYVIQEIIKYKGVTKAP